VGSTVKLNSGDIVYDSKSHDKGLLIKRKIEPGIHSQGGFSIFIWEIYWLEEKHTYYTEDAIINMIEVGHLILYKNT
tara:strand:- start:6703 stop:6933 length:231 start_codon:yes stop_codon:yes gene_type:complete